MIHIDSIFSLTGLFAEIAYLGIIFSTELLNSTHPVAFFFFFVITERLKVVPVSLEMIDYWLRQHKRREDIAGLFPPTLCNLSLFSRGGSLCNLAFYNGAKIITCTLHCLFIGHGADKSTWIKVFKWLTVMDLVSFERYGMKTFKNTQLWKATQRKLHPV